MATNDQLMLETWHDLFALAGQVGYVMHRIKTRDELDILFELEDVIDSISNIMDKLRNPTEQTGMTGDERDLEQ